MLLNDGIHLRNDWSDFDFALLIMFKSEYWENIMKCMILAMSCDENESATLYTIGVLQPSSNTSQIRTFGKASDAR